MQRRITRTVSAAAAALLTALACGQIKWQPSFDAAMKAAKASNKLVMVEFYTSWDVDTRTAGGHWSARLESETFGNSKAQVAANKFIPVRLDAEKNGKALADKFHITNYPTVLFLDHNQSVAGVIDGFEDGSEFIKHTTQFLKDHSEYGPAMAKYKENPKSLDAVSKLGAIYADRYQITPALGKLKEAEALDPQNKSEKLTDMYNSIGDHYQNASQYESAIKYFQKAADTSSVTDKKAYALLSIATCYLTMDRPADPNAVIDSQTMQTRVKEHFQKARPYVQAALKLPKLKAEDREIAETDLKDIDQVLSSLGG